MIKVEALNTYESRGIKDKNLNRIPKEGETFEVEEERLKVLLGGNKYDLQFVKVYEEPKENETEETFVNENIEEENNESLDEKLSDDIISNDNVEESKEETKSNKKKNK